MISEVFGSRARGNVLCGNISALCALTALPGYATHTIVLILGYKPKK
jgi:hypothetical protein